MNKQGFILFESILILVCISTLILSLKNINNVMMPRLNSEKKLIDNYLKTNQIKECNQECLIKKALQALN